jgi:hypothetical protein
VPVSVVLGGGWKTSARVQSGERNRRVGRVPPRGFWGIFPGFLVGRSKHRKGVGFRSGISQNNPCFRG